MLNLTFGEQVKIILNRKGMTIKDLAELIEETTGQKMSRQNLTQKLNRDNFQEQDMRQIAKVLGCPFQLSILSASEPTEKGNTKRENAAAKETNAMLMQELTIGDLIELGEIREAERKREEPPKRKEKPREEAQSESGGKDSPALKDLPEGSVNPYTRREYESNSVRMHPKRIGYVQVYDRTKHKWTDMTQWAFLGYQERKKKLLGGKYVPPVYLD